MANESTNKGIIYILTNKAMPDLVKIGVTTKRDPNTRFNELYNTSVPFPFDCACAIEVDDCGNIERAFHLAFGDCRVNPNREFFKISPEKPAALLRLMGTDITDRFSKEIDQTAPEADREAARRFRRPNLNFREMGIPVGATLVFTEDPAVSVSVASDRKVHFGEEECSLTKVTQNLLKSSHAVRPTIYWTFNGRPLHEIYEETYSPDADGED